MTQTAYILERPENCTSAVVFASPHSGRDYPEQFLSQSVLDSRAIRTSEDAFVDRLFQSAPAFGSPLLLAGVPRAFVDFNRNEDELDPALIAGVRGQANNPRVASGLGVIPRVVANSRAIYSGKLTKQDAEVRIADYWRPYHKKLQSLLDSARTVFGQSILVDCHSMPHEALEHLRGNRGRCPEIVLGDRFGVSATAEIVDAIEAGFVDAGFTVSRNAPFAGAYVTQHYGRPARNQHAVQIEIDRSLYMDEARIMPKPEFAEIAERLRPVISRIVEIGQLPQRLAAE